MNYADFLFGVIVGVPLGFMWAAWVAYRAKERAKKKLEDSVERLRSGIVNFVNLLKDHADVQITIVDRNGEFELETEEDPPAALSSRPRKGLH